MPITKIIPPTNTTFCRRLLKWYTQNARDLPWRSEPSLYKTVVSEFMLQQTQVDTVLPYFSAWLETFPTFEVLAKADETTVMKHWEGLGYYSRARNLHRLAKHIDQYGLPSETREAWLKLPGIGPYTSAAILSIALLKPIAVVDGNVIRVISRLLAIETDFPDNTAAMKAITPHANALINANHPGDHNQAMMELGATVCTRNPTCEKCPVQQHCTAFAKNLQHTLPNLKRKKITHKSVNRAWLVSNGKILLHKGEAKAKRLANIYELPCYELLNSGKPEGEPLAIKKRGISNERVTETIYQYSQSVNIAGELGREFAWVKLEELSKLTLSGPHKKWIAEILAKSKIAIV